MLYKMKSSLYHINNFGRLLLFISYAYCSSISITPPSQTIFIGENAEFKCNVNESPSDSSVFWNWFKNETYVIANEMQWIKGSYTVKVANEQKTSTLTLLNATFEDNASTYHCYLDKLNARANLTVIRLDSMYPKCDSNTSKVNIDKTVYMKCSANSGGTTPLLQWYRNGDMLSKKEDFYNGQYAYFDEFTYNVTVEDEGVIFLCKVEAWGGNETCRVLLNVPPTVLVSSNATTFTAGDSIEFKCLAMTPWNITNYIWIINERPIAESDYKFIVKYENTTLIINELTSNSSGAVIKCQVITSTNLTGINSLTISLFDESNNLLIDLVYIVVGILIAMILICIIAFILAKRRQRHYKTSFTKTRNSEVHGVPLESPTFFAEEDAVEYQNSQEYINGTHIRIDLDKEEHFDCDEKEIGFETYVNAGSVASLGSFCSYNSFENNENCESVDNDGLYSRSLKAEEKVSAQPKTSQDFGDLNVKPIKKTNTDTLSVDGLIDSRDLYAKPNKKKHIDSLSIDGLIDSRELYAKPNKSYKNKSIHHSLENILYNEKHTYDNRSESIDDLYSKPNKRQTTQTDYLADLYAQPHKQRTARTALKPRPITTLPDKTSPSSNVIEQDFTYSSIA